MIKVRYTEKGGEIEFNKYSRGPMLFLEWLQSNHHWIMEIKTFPNSDDVLHDKFKVKFKNIPKGDLASLYGYLKENDK